MRCHAVDVATWSRILEGPCRVISGASALQFGLCLRHTWNPRALLALNLTCRRRLRCMKHFDVRLLAIQQCVAEQRLSMCKVGTSTNVADLLTTHVSNAVHSFLMPVLGSQRPGAFCLSATIQCVGEVHSTQKATACAICGAVARRLVTATLCLQLGTSVGVTLRVAQNVTSLKIHIWPMRHQRFSETGLLQSFVCFFNSAHVQSHRST